MRSKLMLFVVVVITAILGLMLYSLACGKETTGIPHDKQHNIVLRFEGTDSELPADGQLLIVKRSLEDTLVVGPASDDDCRRILEEHGKG